ncbi:MAG: alpha/beta hydrolase [Planctomycetota bacterium]
MTDTARELGLGPRRTPGRRLLRTALITVLLGYGLICLLMAIGQRHFPYFPRPVDPTTRQLLSEQALAIDGVEAWLVHPDAPGPLLLYCGGNAEDAADAALRWHGREHSVLCWNYPGYGASPGAPSEEAIIAAGGRVLDWIERSLPERRLIIVGRSLGSAVAVALAGQRRPAGLVLVSPMDSVRAVAARHHPLLPVCLLLQDTWRSDQRAADLDLPLLVLLGTADRTVPPSHSQALAALWPGLVTVVELPGSSHNDTAAHPDYWPAIATFIGALEGAG